VGDYVAVLIGPGHASPGRNVTAPEDDADVGLAVGCGTYPEADVVEGSTLGSMPASSLALFIVPTSFWLELSTATASFCSDFSSDFVPRLMLSEDQPQVAV
jgi:hypothetical protein